MGNEGRPRYPENPYCKLINAHIIVPEYKVKYNQQLDAPTGNPSCAISLPLALASDPPQSGTVTPDTRASVPAVAHAQCLQTPANGSGTSLDPDNKSIMTKLGIGPHLAVC
jgi:hypothetical protein